MSGKLSGAMRAKLEALRAELRQSLGANSEVSAPVELDQTRQGRLSRMDAMQQQAMAQAGQARARARLAAVEAALKRCEDGTYGECRDCGEPIGSDRLTAKPEARLCIGCEAAREQ